MTKQFFKQVNDELIDGKAPASRSEMDNVQDAIKRYEIAGVALTTYSRQNVPRDWLAHREEVIAAIKAGQAGDFSAISREDFERSYAVKQEAAREEMRRAVQDLMPVAVKIRDRYIKQLKDAAEKAETDEKKRHERFGVPYSPSGFIIALGKAAAFVLARCNDSSSYVCCHPAELLPFLEL
jgi:hypothetical protein